MEIKMQCELFDKATRLRDIGKGNTFRQPGTCKTVWMVTANNSKNPKFSNKIRTVSLKVGAVAYKEPDMEVVRVKGSFVVEEWGAHPQDK